MLKPICDVCRREVKGDIRIAEHYCERCLPFAEEYRARRIEVTADALLYVERKVEQFRNEFLRDTVVPQTKQKLESVK